MTDEQEIRVLRFNNIFNVRDVTKKPVVDIVSIYGKLESFPGSLGEKLTPEMLCIDIKYHGEISTHSFRWVDSEGICDAALSSPGDPKYTCKKNTLKASGNINKVHIRRNLQITDIFLNKDHPERRICHCVPCVSDDIYAIFLQFYAEEKPLLTLITFDFTINHVQLTQKHYRDIHSFSLKQPKIFDKMNFLKDL